jgi:hypothetical protein
MGSINFDLYTVTLELERAKEFGIKLSIAGLAQSFKFRARDAVEFESWSIAIKNHLAGSQGHH